LIGVGIYAVYYFMSRKLEAAETAAGSKIDAISAGLKGSVAGVAASIGTGLTSLLKGKGTAAGAQAGAGAAAAASGFVGPLQPAAAVGTGYTGGLAGLGTVGVLGAVATAAFFVYSAFHKIFPSKDPEWEAIERKLQEARAAGKPIISQVTKASLKAPVR
jgi:hypothetical protein